MTTVHETEGTVTSLHCNCGATWTFKDGAVEYKSGKPQQRKPLTDAQILRLLSKIDECAVRLPRGLREFARAIEAAHGITSVPDFKE